MDLEPRQRFGILGAKVRPSAEPLIKSSRQQPLGTRERQRKVHHVRPTTACQLSLAVPSRCLVLVMT